MRLLGTRLQIVIGALLVVILGCGSEPETGKPLSFPKEKDATVFGVRTITESTITNRFGKPIDGLVLLDASLIQNAEDLASSKHQHYVVFRDFLLGNGVRGRYWQQQSEKQKGLGLPEMDSRSTVVTIVTVNLNGIVTESRSLRASHVQISVDTNDFSRSFTP
jgi:hypothetical protein